MSEADPDIALLARVGRGDAAAVRQLVTTKLPLVLGLAVRLLRDRGEAEDVTQEAFLRVWRYASRWEPGGARFDTWLHTVVLNLCRDRLRARPMGVASEAAPELVDPAPNAEVSLIDAERGRAVADAITRLPERQREAILLVHYQDRSGAEAARAMNITVEALESLLARARRTLHVRLVGTREGDADV